MKKVFRDKNDVWDCLILVTVVTIVTILSIFLGR
jgi:hypothetical protein